MKTPSKYTKIYQPFKRTPDGKEMTTTFAMDEFRILLDSPCWSVQEKIDGMNMRIGILQDGSPFVGGKTDNAVVPGDLQKHCDEIAARMIDAGLPAGTTLYGEGYGAGIQKGGYYRADKAFIGFDVLAPEEYWYPLDVAEEITKAAGARFVEVEGENLTLRALIEDAYTGFFTRYCEPGAAGGVAEG